LNRLWLDQGLPRGTAKLLNAKGWDVVHVGDIGMSRAPDAEILALAEREARVCITRDADFHTLLALSRASRPSPIRIRVEGLNAAGLAELLTHVVQQIGDELTQGAAVTADVRKLRLRRLPLLPAA